MASSPVNQAHRNHPLHPFATALLIFSVSLASGACGSGSSTSDGSRVTDKDSAAELLTTGSSEPLYNAQLPDKIEVPDSIKGLEGIAISKVGDIFVGDLQTGDVWRRAHQTGEFALLAAGERDGRVSAVGLALKDDDTKLLIATGSNHRLDVIDTSDGSLATSYPLDSTDASFVNDVTAAPDGTIYITDSGSPRIWSVAPGASESVLWLNYESSDLVDTKAAAFQGNGIVVNRDELIFNHMASNALLKVNRTTREISKIAIDHPGRDGLVLCKDQVLYGVDLAALNDGQDVVRVNRLDEGLSKSISSEDLIDDSLSSPTTLAVAGKHLVVVNAQYAADPVQTPFWLSVFAIPDC